MKRISRKLKGKIRQRRGLLYREIENQVNLSAQYIFEHHKSVDVACAGSNEGFEILFLASEHDLPLAIENARRTKALYGGCVLRITIVSPNANLQTDEDFVFIEDKELGVDQEISKVFKLFGNRAGWMRQQYLKSKFVHQADNPVLIIDSDTFLQVPINWQGKDGQILLVNTEDFHVPYNVHISRFLGIPVPALNFVSHIQLQEPAIVREIYSDDFDEGWERWARASWKFGEDSPASEFQTYAAYLLSQFKAASIIFPKHKTLSAENKTLGEILDSELTHNCDIVTIGQKLLLVSNID